MPITDTLENAKRLESLGFTHDQAQGLSEILESTGHATQQDLKTFIGEHLAAMEKRLEDRWDNRFSKLESIILRELRSQMFWFFAMLVALLGLTIAVIKFLP